MMVGLVCVAVQYPKGDESIAYANVAIVDTDKQEQATTLVLQQAALHAEEWAA